MSMRYKGGVVSAPGATSTTSAASGVWSLRQQMRAQAASAWPVPTAVGQVSYTSPGTYSWVAPAGVSSVSVVCVGGGGASGGGLGYKNNYAVTAGSSYTVVVGTGGVSGDYGTNGGNSYFVSTGVVLGGGGNKARTGYGGTHVGDGGGDGGGVMNVGGGGAGGYSGVGGAGSTSGGINGSAGTGGGGGGGGDSYIEGTCEALVIGGGGGGVSINGQSYNGTGGTARPAKYNAGTQYAYGGNGGSGGVGGGTGTATSNGAQITAFSYGTGGTFGGGAAFSGALTGSAGGSGAVRIIWPGTTRQFPSTNTADM